MFLMSVSVICKLLKRLWRYCKSTKPAFPKALETRIDVYETLCPQQMLVYKGDKIKNRGGECKNVTPTKLQCLNIQRALQVFEKMIIKKIK